MGQKSNKLSSKYCNTLAEFFDTLTNGKHVVSSIDFEETTKGGDMAVFRCRPNEEILEGGNNVNCVIASFVTAYGRLKLLQALRTVRPYHLGYSDTDSIIYRTDTRSPPLFETSTRLGDLSDELEKYGRGSYITQLVCAGSKNYSYEFYNAGQACLDYVTKIRGFSLNFTNSKELNFDVMKSMILNRDFQKTIVITDPRKIIRYKHTLLTTDQERKYKVILDKRRILPDLSTLPWGY